jgi:hypothetical protein
MKQETKTGKIAESGETKAFNAHPALTYGFAHDVCETPEEADTEVERRKLTIVELVNDYILLTARSAAYQDALSPYKKSTMSDADVRERMVKDAMRLGKSKEQAEAFVDSLLSA